jgi:superfamily II helicase
MFNLQYLRTSKVNIYSTFLGNKTPQNSVLQVYAERSKIAESNSCKSLEWNSRLTNDFDIVKCAEDTICTVFQKWIYLKKVFSVTKLYELDKCGLGFKKQYSDQNYSADVTDYLGPILNTKKTAVASPITDKCSAKKFTS